MKLKAWAFPANSKTVADREKELAWYEKPWKEPEPRKNWKPKAVSTDVDDEGFQWHPAGAAAAV